MATHDNTTHNSPEERSIHGIPPQRAKEFGRPYSAKEIEYHAETFLKSLWAAGAHQTRVAEILNFKPAVAKGITVHTLLEYRRGIDLLQEAKTELVARFEAPAKKA